MALNASQQLKVVGALVIGLSGLLLFGAALGLAVDQDKIIDALLGGMALGGLATGRGLLRLRPWARLSSLVFYSLLCICGALSVAYIVVRISTSPSGSISTESVDSSGLVFAGFGGRDVFPCVKSYVLELVVHKKLRYVPTPSLSNDM